jgi:stage II sporulation protein GA (sporulation sigma-E factor processing peptidase)
MEVYIEIVVFDNLMINLLLIYAVKTALRLNITRWRMLLAAVGGAGLAVALPFVSDFQYLYKLGAAAAMPLLFGGFKSIKSYLLNAVVFIILSFALGGAVFAAGQWLPFFRGGSGILGASAACGLFLLYGLRQMMSGMRSKNAGGEAAVRIHTEQGVITAAALVDSGNKLTDALTGKPVIVVTSGLLNGAGLISERCIKVRTVVGERELPLVMLKRVEIAPDYDPAKRGRLFKSSHKKMPVVLTEVPAALSPEKGRYGVILPASDGL